ncbi:hypothetical protein J6590_063164 [Homalodisca vitripennis]|nr:hypothetical protein J6590_063164 [Homalodisca vitripennis]
MKVVLLLLGSVLLLAAKEYEAAGLLAHVPCYDFNKVLFHDETYQREKWKPGSRVIHQRGRNDVTPCLKIRHYCKYCDLQRNGLRDEIETYPHRPSPTHFQFYLRTTRRGHSVEYRIQFYGQYFVRNHSKAKASFTCIVVNKLFSSEGDRTDTGCDFKIWPSE